MSFSDIFDRRIGYGFFSDALDGVLRRTCGILERSALTPPAFSLAIRGIDTSSWDSVRPPFENAFLGPDPIGQLHIWTLFRGLFEGEHTFCENGLPSWDHEGVLTGELLSRLVDAVKAMGLKVHTLTGKDPGLAFCRTNTVLDRGEAISGADFGLIIQHRDIGFVSFAIQVKRVEGDRADVSHTVRSSGELQRNLLNRTPGLGHYLFLHKPLADRSVPPPTMCPASVVVAETAKTGTDTFEVFDHSSDLAVYLTFGPFADRPMRIGVLSQSADAAARCLLEGYPRLASALDKVIVIRAGHGRTYDWEALLQAEADRVLGSTEIEPPVTGALEGPDGP